MPDLLIELRSEEIPARMQARAAEDLKRLMTDALVEAGLTYGGAAAFSTPRRLTLAVEGLSPESAAVREERKGPRTDAPEKAIEGFLRSTGLERAALEIRDDKKGEVYFAVIERPGRPAAEIVADALDTTIRNFPWPKSMRWGSGDLRWVRPLRSILVILTSEAGAEVVPFEIAGLQAGDTTVGHRQTAPAPFAVSSFDDYVAKLRKGHVVLNPTERAEHIWADAESAAFAQGLELVEDKGLLAEVANLVEWPAVLMGEIGEEFLELPPEVLQTSMKEHQKFFSVRNAKTGRIEKFVTVANVAAADGGATILAGNQKVLAARLSDAKFFWENDLRVARGGMGDWLTALENVTFHARLGTVADRIGRIALLAGELAPMVDAAPATARDAARVAKADLASEMVYEFPELQGTMGRYYAEAAGLSAEIAEAAEAHYSPLGPSDDVPAAPVSVAVALADKLDTLTGFWAIDEKPTGSKDPFALRRAALGVIRLVLANELRLPLDRFFDRGLLLHKVALETQGASGPELQALEDFADEVADHGVFGAAIRTVVAAIADRHEGAASVTRIAEAVPDKSDDLLSFFHDRLKVHLRDEGLRHDVIDACLAMPGSDDLTLLVARARALQEVVGTEDGENLVQGFRRANNILTQAEEADGVEYSFGPDAKLAETDEERALFAALDTAEAAIGPAMETEDFAAAMHAMAGLRPAIDGFFEGVQVNSENQVLRRNRLNLLHRIREICLSTADLRKIEG
ncbi:glycine--tRNA ligase subunit beta [Ovoidimarina sediminis]|uniref:glycine--tRNA ligase subunit beta n=1 Tax=Ovoidimarina sediminis TaxID=3079856 RepID=UPI0029076362|nr:glycine--tRNA ligase subunit beta [Rhodophyticola sp. MJ-SS7]MDU8943863.1 glycine--tRNA ligase subunit beta [Rhodophyticola sp. MJ-SS7]